MSSRFRIEGAALALLLLAGCQKANKGDLPAQQSDGRSVITSAFVPGVNHSLVSDDPRAAQYYDDAAAVTTGKKLFAAYNCAGCHSNGGGGMGPDLMDDVWVYGGRLTQIHQTLVEGRPNGMPSWGGKVPDAQLWQISAYVRSLSLPATLAAQHGPTPGQNPAPVPRAADAHSGWAPPKDTTNDYTTTTEGPR